MVRRLSFLFVLCVLLVSGCASRLSMTVDSIGAQSKDVRYVILPGAEGMRLDDLLFVEYEKQLAALLASMDYQVTENEANSTAVVFLSWFTEEIAGGASDGASVGVGMGGGSGGHRRGGGSFMGMGLGLGFPMGGSAPSTTIRHRVILDAYHLTPGAQNPVGKNLWRVTLVAADDENNLRAAFPLMMEAARPYIGNDSNGPVTVSVPRKK